MKFREYIQEFKPNPDRDWLLYHGSQYKFNSFKPGIVFLTDSDEDAVNFGLQKHNIKSSVKSAWLYTLAVMPGKIYDGNDVINSFVMEEDHPEILEKEYMDVKGDLDLWIEKFFGPKLRRKGYRFLTFEHPSFSGDEIEVTVSLFPEKDIEIVDIDKI